MIILASSSPRRKQLLEWAEVEFKIITYPTDENIPENVAIEEVPIHIAREKAHAVKSRIQTREESHPIGDDDYPILAADTIVVFGTEVLGKPANRQEAIDMLTKLQGNHHKVITGVVLLSGEKEIAFSDVTEVEFHPLANEEIVFYVDCYKPFDKAGAYAIQEWIGVVGIKGVHGDFYNVMGLPVSRVIQAINSL